MANAKTGVVALDARDLETRAIAMRRAGASFRTIASRLGCSTGAAHKAVCRVLERTLGDLAESAGALRALELERLDAMLMAIWPAATGGDPAAISVALRISERRSWLLGLDAPTRSELTGAEGGPVTFVEAMRAFAAERATA